MSASPTLLSRFFANADRLGSRPMCRFYAGDRWMLLGWRTAGRLVRDLASGLLALGHGKGAKLAIVCQTRREWGLVDLANMSIGGVTVGVYPTMTAEQSRYVIAHSDARIVVVEDRAQLEKVLSVKDQLPSVESIVVIDPTGTQLGGECMSLAEALALGRAAPKDVEARVAEIGPESAATFVYTSGTTGPPKAAMITHANIVAALECLEALHTHDDDFGFSFLPMAHVLQRLTNYNGVWRGVAGGFARSLATIGEDMLENRPTVVAAVPRVFEKVYAKAHERAAATPTRKRIFDWALRTGHEVARLRQAHEPLPRTLAVEYAVARRLVFTPLRERLGGRIRLFLTGGAPIAKEILEFFSAADITILEGWGMTETCSVGTLNLPGAVRYGSIGRPLGGVEMRLDDDGEILIRGPSVFSGYYKDDAATRASFTSDGYFRTGDVGKVDADGFYYIVDRKKDLIITAGGKNVAPQNIENLIKTDPRIAEVVVVGDRRPYLTALVAVAPEVRAAASEEEIQSLVETVIEQKNVDLASYERVKRFRVLPGELAEATGELTPTLKVRRKVVADKYAGLIRAMYEE